MDPATATLITTLGEGLISAIFTPPKPQLSQAQIAAILEQRRREEESKRAWLIGGGLAAAAVVLYLVLAARK